MILPGVTGCSQANYIKEMVLGAHRSGYHAVVINSLASEDEKEMDGNYRVLDFSDSQIVRQSINVVHKRLGEDAEIYGVGFSLGANHLLRYLGDHHHDSCMKAAVSVSNPFDVMATCVQLKYRFFGIYDKSIRVRLAEPFISKKFKHEDYGQEWYSNLKNHGSIVDFDNSVRSKILGYNSVHSLYRNVSW
jgi:predicted alpha/beta-fold hydrolase